MGVCGGIVIVYFTCKNKEESICEKYRFSIPRIRKTKRFFDLLVSWMQLSFLIISCMRSIAS